jgi:hypothetical protein
MKYHSLTKGKRALPLTWRNMNHVHLIVGMTIKPISADIRPNHTRFDGENPS